MWYRNASKYLSYWLYVGSRINTGGRVGKSSHGTNLLVNNNPQEVFKIATELDQFNKRQYLEKDVLDKIQKKLKMIYLIQ